jgi:hypothetical protein
MRRFTVAVLVGVLAVLFLAGPASADGHPYTQPPGNTPVVGTDSGDTSGDSEVLGTSVERSESRRVMFAATGSDLVGLAVLGGGLVGLGFLLRRSRRPRAQAV